MKDREFLGAVLFLVLGTGLYAGARTEGFRMAAGGTAGTYYAYGSAAGRILGKKTGIPISVLATGASMANIRLVAAGEVELAIAQNDVMDYAWRGTDLFNGEKITGFAALAALYTEVCQVVANPASGIRTIADLKGKNISVGDVGSGTEFNARQILEAYGIGFDEIGKFNLGFGASADALQNRRIDAFFCVSGAPTVAITALAMEMDIVILEIDDPHAQWLIQKYPFYTPFPIPGGSYQGQPSPVKTVTVKATIIVGERLPRDTVYKLTKALFESKAEIQAVHGKGVELSVFSAVDGISIPLHPGAEKYFREAGVIK